MVQSHLCLIEYIMKIPPPIILASSSQRRIELFKKLDLPFKIEKADIDEKPKPKETAYQMVKRLSFEKAKKISQKYPAGNCWIIAADTTVVLEKEILGKPKNKKEAIKMLQRLSGRSHWVFTGITILHPKTKKKITHVEKTKVFFRQLSFKEIVDYVNKNELMDKAGAYAAQEQAALFIKRIEGDFYNVVGLPICWLSSTLKKLTKNV